MYGPSPWLERRLAAGTELGPPLSPPRHQERGCSIIVMVFALRSYLAAACLNAEFYYTTILQLILKADDRYTTIFQQLPDI